MTPHAALISELYLVATNAEAAAVVFRAAHGRAPLPFGQLHDHRTQILGELLDAIESVEPGLGQRIHAAMDPIHRGEPAPLPPGQQAPREPGKTSAQVLLEIAALKALCPRLRPRSAFGDDNLAALRAQIQVLEDRMTPDQVRAAFGNDKDTEPFDQHVRDAALHAAAWLLIDMEAPSRDWLPLCNSNEAGGK